MSDDAQKAVARLLNRLVPLLDEFARAQPHADGWIRVDPRAVEWHVTRLERIALAVDLLGAAGDICTPYAPRCWSRTAGQECSCESPRLVVPRIRRKAAAEHAPSRRTSTGRLLVMVPDDSGDA